MKTLRVSLAIGLLTALATTSVTATGAGATAAGDVACTRGTFKNFHNEGQPGVPPPGYSGPLFSLSQNYPNPLPAPERYPWLNVNVDHLGDGASSAAYLAAVYSYVTAGNIAADWVVQRNKVRPWYHAPWLDAGPLGREFVHGLTHELDSPPGLLGPGQTTWTQTWAMGAYNAPGAWAMGQVWCNPTAPDLGALNPDANAANSFPNGTAVWKLLFTSATTAQLPYLGGTLTWQADIFKTQGDKSPDPARAIGPVQLLQMDVAVRDDRLENGWAFGTFAYAKNAPGPTVWDRMVPIGLQWGNDPGITPAMLQAGATLKESWIGPLAKKYGLPNNHLGWGGRLVGPLDNPQSSCMSCHQTAGSPQGSLDPVAPANGTLTDRVRLQWFTNVPAGVAFAPTGQASSDYSLQLSTGLQHFYLATCNPRVLHEHASARGPRVAAPASLALTECNNLTAELKPPATDTSWPARGWLWVAIAVLGAALLAMPFVTARRRNSPISTTPGEKS